MTDFWSAIGELGVGEPGAGGGEGERLQKVLARAGYGSRRACEQLIEARRVRVNGEVALLGRRVDPETDAIEVDHVRVSAAPGLVHYLLNKPRGVVTTARDPEGRATVVQLVPPAPRVFPVGRLDADTEGLLLLTNDGDLAQRLAHPSHGVEKEYLADVVGRLTPAELRRLREGVELDDGPTAPARVAQGPDGLVRITIHEGRNRQVRRMLDAVGHPVLRLARTRIGPVRDDRLRPGQWRSLTPAELQSLNAAATPARTRRERRAEAAQASAGPSAGLPGRVGSVPTARRTPTTGTAGSTRTAGTT